MSIRVVFSQIKTSVSTYYSKFSILMVFWHIIGFTLIVLPYEEIGVSICTVNEDNDTGFLSLVYFGCFILSSCVSALYFLNKSERFYDL